MESQLRPTRKHALCLEVAVVVELAQGCRLIGGIAPAGFFLYFCLLGKIALLEAVAHGFQTWEHLAITRIDHVADPIAHPEGILHREGKGISPRRVIAFGTLGVATIDGGVGYHVAVVVAKPQHAANLTGKP